MVCRLCREREAAQAIGVCADCLRAARAVLDPGGLHGPVRARFGLPASPPATPGGVACGLCANDCRLGPGQKGYCGLHLERNGRLAHAVQPGSALAHMYFDPLPTNCCASWFCRGSGERGTNLAVFFYGCNLDCLFCQNASHKELDGAPVIDVEAMVQAALEPHVRCVCFFGGSPEPQLPFALEVSRRVIERSGNTKHICWEWNGCGSPKLVERAAELSLRSGGVVKFDLKAARPEIARALCGVDTSRSFENFSRIAATFRESGLLTATTLLVPHYVDALEVEAVARFIAGLDAGIPYSLLIFHPDFQMRDLPVTPRGQIDACVEAARRYLRRVNLGNTHLLRFAR
ncbi:MAG: radical SAM protein [Syntrophaceae bacterium]|nr:radical SAM protein [Syntrophaceae bacterium]